MNINEVRFAGRLTRDPQLKYLPSNTPVAEFGMVANRKFRTGSGEDREEATFVDVTAFGKTAETLNQYVGKGDELYVSGRLKFDSWEDRQGGGRRSKLSLIADSFQFVGGRRSGGEPGEDQTQTGYRKPRLRQRDGAEDSGQSEYDDDSQAPLNPNDPEIPF
jgi:single-strand DNA-binding protein